MAELSDETPGPRPEPFVAETLDLYRASALVPKVGAETLLPPPARGGEAGPHLLPGQLLLGDFEVGEEGMGVVYLGRSRSTGQRFALKTITAARLGDEESRQNFLTELETWIDLPEHPHLVAYRFFRTLGEELAIFAEFVDGGSLAS